MNLEDGFSGDRKTKRTSLNYDGKRLEIIVPQN
jgi:hypothetical protein